MFLLNNKWRTSNFDPVFPSFLTKKINNQKVWKYMFKLSPYFTEDWDILKPIFLIDPSVSFNRRLTPPLQRKVHPQGHGEQVSWRGNKWPKQSLLVAISTNSKQEWTVLLQGYSAPVNLLFTSPMSFSGFLPPKRYDTVWYMGEMTLNPNSLWQFFVELIFEWTNSVPSGGGKMLGCKYFHYNAAGNHPEKCSTCGIFSPKVYMDIFKKNPAFNEHPRPWWNLLSECQNASNKNRAKRSPKKSHPWNHKGKKTERTRTTPKSHYRFMGGYTVSMVTPDGCQIPV